MSKETEKPETQADEIQANESQQQEIEQDETLPQSEEESATVEALPKSGEEPLQADREVAKNQPSQEGEPKATEPEEKAEGPQPNPRLPPTSMHPVKKAVRWVIIGCLVMFGLYQCGYSSGQSEERLRNALRPPEEKVIIQTDLKAIDEAVKNERAKQRVLTEAQFQVVVDGLEKNLGQLKSELEYQQLWARFASGEDAGRCTKGAYSGQVSCTNGIRADLNEYLARLEARNVCASGEWTAVQSDAPTESAASEASAASVAQSAPKVEYKDGLVFKFCQRPEFGSSDS